DPWVYHWDDSRWVEESTVYLRSLGSLLCPDPQKAWRADCAALLGTVTLDDGSVCPLYCPTPMFVLEVNAALENQPSLLVERSEDEGYVIIGQFKRDDRANMDMYPCLRERGEDRADEK
ncbi:hypothetical protein KIPB_016629, partial [Kipferlia bialata]